VGHGAKGDAEFVHLAIEAGQADAQGGGGGVLVKGTVFQDFQDVPLFEGAEGEAEIGRAGVEVGGVVVINGGVQIVVLTGEGVLQQDALEPEDEFIGGDGLGEKVAGPGAESLDDAVDLGAGAADEDDGLGRGGVGLTSEQFPTNAGEEQLGDEGLDPSPLEDLQRLLAVGTSDP